MKSQAAERVTDRPLVSVVVPSYNHAAYIERAIRSIAAQTYRPLEVVVVDDGSTDDSVERIRDVRAQLLGEREIPPFVRFGLFEQANAGADRALGRAIAEAKGSVISILNSDDVYAPRRLERLVPVLVASGGVVFSGVDFIDADDARLDEGNDWSRWYEAGARLAEELPTAGFGLLLRNFAITSSNFVFARELHDRLGGFCDYRFAHDWDFLLRSLYYREATWVAAPLLSYRVHGANTTEQVRDRLLEESLGALRRYSALFAASPSPNRLAPWESNWPDYFPRFAREHSPAFAEASLSDVLARL